MGGENQGGNENEVVNCSFRYVDAVMSKDLELAYKDQSNVLDPRCSISWFRPTANGIVGTWEKNLKIKILQDVKLVAITLIIIQIFIR